MSSSWAIIEDNGEVLFVRRALDLGRGGQWCPPGGTIWDEEWAETACIREVYEETGLRVSIDQPIAVFETAHYFRCSLNSSRDQLSLHPDECIDSAWIAPEHLLDIGTIMDLRRIIPILDLADLRPPSPPEGLSLAVPDEILQS